MDKLNIPQMNRQLLMIEHADEHNNYFDCDVIEDAKQDVRRSETLEEATEAINYLIVSVEYRMQGKQCKTLRTLRDEFNAYTSLLQAEELHNQAAIDWWMKEAEKGSVMRIM